MEIITLTCRSLFRYLLRVKYKVSLLSENLVHRERLYLGSLLTSQEYHVKRTYSLPPFFCDCKLDNMDDQCPEPDVYI